MSGAAVAVAASIPGNSLELAHEAAVDPVLPAPHPGALERQRAARGHRISIAGADEREPLALRAVGLERSSLDRAAQVLCQRRTLTHGEYPRLLARVVHHAGDVACGEHPGVGQRLQGVAHLNEPVRIEREAGVAQPWRAAGARDPDDFVGIHAFAARRLQARRRYRVDIGAAMQGYTAFGQYPLECDGAQSVVGRQDHRIAGEQVEAKLIRVASPCAQLLAQAVLHRQSQFDPAGAAADHGDAHGAGVLAHAR